MSTPHKCPSCDGYGDRVNPVWLNPPGSTSSLPPQTIPCRACGGIGIVWEPESPAIGAVLHYKWEDGKLVVVDECEHTINLPATPPGEGRDGE